MALGPTVTPLVGPLSNKTPAKPVVDGRCRKCGTPAVVCVKCRENWASCGDAICDECEEVDMGGSGSSGGK